MSKTDAVQALSRTQPLRHEGYQPCFQPIVSLTTGRIDGYESLARHRDDDGALISVGSLFTDPKFQVDERIGLDRVLRRRAFEYFASRPDAGYLSVNVSPGWVERLEEITEHSLPSLTMAREAGIDPSRIVVEITETSGDLGKLSEAVRLYQSAGMMVAIDDFGTGASQVDRIAALRPNIVKLDMRHFKDAARDKGVGLDIALAVQSIASRVGCQVVCEGVENEWEFNFGVHCGCSHVQGFIFSRAREGLQNPELHRPRVLELKSSCLEERVVKLGEVIDLNSRIKDAILHIRTMLMEGRSRSQALSLEPEVLYQMGMLRYFICDLDGTQISPNYEVRRNGILRLEHPQEMNWGHRPYFALFLAHRGRSFHNIYSSTIYRDIGTRIPCQTFGHFLDDGRLLLVDVKMKEPDLLVDTGFEPY